MSKGAATNMAEKNVLPQIRDHLLLIGFLLGHPKFRRDQQEPGPIIVIEKGQPIYMTQKIPHILFYFCIIVVSFDLLNTIVLHYSISVYKMSFALSKREYLTLLSFP